MNHRIVRLRAALLSVRSDSITYYGNLIKHAIRDERSHRYVIQIDPHLQELYTADMADWLDGTLANHGLVLWTNESPCGNCDRLCISCYEASLVLKLD